MTNRADQPPCVRGKTVYITWLAEALAPRCAALVNSCQQLEFSLYSLVFPEERPPQRAAGGPSQPVTPL